jgi:polyisoprenoid-binding protein YceI
VASGASPVPEGTDGITAPIAALAPVDTATTAPATTVAPPARSVDGQWVTGPGSQARYAIDDTVLGQTQRVVGSTDQLSGSMQITGNVVEAARVVVDMRTISCGCVHDGKYQDMLDTDRYPTSTFELTSPIPLSAIPADGEVVQVPVTGEFTIHGVTRSVRFTLDAVQRNGRIGVNAVVPVRLPDYQIENPDAGAFGGLSNAEIHLLIGFVHG